MTCLREECRDRRRLRYFKSFEKKMEGPEEIQDPSDSENNPANYDNEPEQARPTKRRAGNLLDYFPPVSEKQDDASDGEPEARPAQLRPAYSVFRHTLDCQLTGRLSFWASSHLRHRLSADYTERLFIDAHPWRTPVLGLQHPLHPSGCIQSAQFDSIGELLVTGGEDGTVLVHNAKSIVAAAQAPGSRDSEHGGFKVELLLALHTGLTKLQSVRWNPSDENVIGAVSSASRLINIYDLQRTQGRATRTLTLPAQSSGGVGAGDIAFFGKSAGPAGARGYSVVVGGPSGQVFLWDLRCSGAPVSTLTSLQGGAVNAVHVLENGQAVLAGTQSGDIKVWDVRGGCGGALRFGGVLHHHPMLACVNLRAALGQVAGLAEQAGGVPSCRIHSMAIDPGAPARVGFHLGCGWSGVLDLASRHITHVHAPPQHLVDEQPSAEDGARALVLWAQTAAPGLRRRACWLADGRRFAVPSRQQDAVMLLDFADSAHAGCRVPSPVEDELAAEASGEAWDEAGEVRLPPAAATVPISQTAICTAAIPNSTMMVACGAHNFMSVLDYS